MSESSHAGRKKECKMNKPTITERKSYISIEYVPTLEIDHLHLQNYVEHGEGEPDHKMWLSLQETIRVHTGESTTQERLFTARFNSTSQTKRQTWLKEQLIICNKMTKEFNVNKKHNLSMIRLLQKEQQKFILSLRRWNASCLLKQKKNATMKREAEQKALTEGEFWKCSEDTLKRFFSVPFDKRKLVSVSEQHRAALFVECVTDWSGEGNYKEIRPTDRAYLCGIDNNGEQWGFRVQQPRDSYYNQRPNWDYDSTVEEAMAIVWDVDLKLISESQRQGEILFHSEPIPESVKMISDGDWQIRPQHCVESQGLEHDDDYFRSVNPIVIEHPTHQKVELPSGTYRVYVHNYNDKD
jgi:hypothetical protein